MNQLDLCAQSTQLCRRQSYSGSWSEGGALMSQQSLNRGEPVAAQRPVECNSFDTLTPRERDVLQQLVAGASNKEAGRQLGISPRTIEIHRARIMEKLGAKNVADVVRMALRLGIQH
jgi:FixJ family two-component response regulator